MKLSHTTQKSLSLEEARYEYVLHLRSSGRSPHTIVHYETSLNHLDRALDALGIVNLAEVRAPHLRQLFVDLQATLRPKTIFGVASDLRAFFNFHQLENDIPSPMAKVRLPRLPQEILPAFTRAEIQALMKVTDGKDVLSIRNRCLILTLLDSGIRLSEAAGMRVGDVDLRTGVFKVMGKGAKERLTRLSPEAIKAMMKYLRIRDGEVGEPLWLGKYGPMCRGGIGETIEQLGKRAGVHAHPHKFRRTCALTMLRNGADIFSVQYLLGHSDLTVLKRYLAQTFDDYLAAHAKYSPVGSLVAAKRTAGILQKRHRDLA